MQAHGEPRPDESAATVSAAADRAAAVRVTVERASRSAARPLAGHGDPRGIAAALMAQRHGWGGGQLACLSSLWGKESTWDVHAENPVSGAYGIPQALPGSKMSSAGSQWRDDPATQITWGLDYIRDTYGSPCGAWDSFRSQGWY